MKVLLLMSFTVAVSSGFYHAHGPPTLVLLKPHDGAGAYSFSHGVVHGGGGSFHKQAGDASGGVSGSYGLKEADGRYRAVHYVADAGGFRASIHSNEPGVEEKNPASVSISKGHQPSFPAAPVHYSFSVPSHAFGHDVTAGQAPESLGEVDGPPSPYSFSYDESSSGGGFHTETGDASGTKRGSYGIKGSDGRVRTVNYVADAGGFRATVDTNEPGVEDNNPADVMITTSGGRVANAPSVGAAGGSAGYGGEAAVFGGGGGAPTAYRFAFGDAASSGPWQQESGDSSGSKSGSYGLRDEDGRTRTVKYVADAGGFRASVSSNEPGVSDKSPADATFSTETGSEAFPATSSDTQTSGTYSFAFGDMTRGPWQKESGDPSGSKSGSYGLRDDDGRVRTVNYVADAGGFRASVSSNEPGVEGSSPADAAFTKSAGPTFHAPSGPFPVTPSGSQPMPAGPAASSGSIPTGFGTTDTSGGYSFSYGDGASGAWQRESGNAAGKMGSYGLNDPDGRSRSVSYTADAGGFRATIASNEPGVDVKGPADVTIRKGHVLSTHGDAPASPHGGAYGGGGDFTSHTAGGGYRFSYGGASFGPWQMESGDASGSKSGSYGLKDIDGRVRSVNYVADAGGFRASISSNEPGVENKNPADVVISTGQEPPGTALVPAGRPSSAFGAPAGYGSQSASAPYSFGYVGSQDGGSSFHKESGDAFGSKMGSYGIQGADGRVRTVHYVADAGGFRAAISSNEPGVDPSKNPADTSIREAGGEVQVSHSALTASSHGPRHHQVAFVAPVIPVAVVHPVGLHYKTDVAHWDLGKARRL